MTKLEENVVIFLTQNRKLFLGLESALKDTQTVVRADNIETVNTIVKQNVVSAIVLHVIGAAGWIIFELVKTSYPQIPRYIVLAPSLQKADFDAVELAKKYGAVGIISELNGIKSLAAMIANQSGYFDTLPQENFLEIYGGIARELERIQHEFNIAGMRTLPQPEIGEDTKKRLKSVLRKLQTIRISP